MASRNEPRTRSIRARVLRIALIPCLAVLLLGAALSGYLIQQGGESLDFAETRRTGLPVVGKYVASLQEERRLTMAVLAGGSDAERAQLAERRAAVDTELVQVIEYGRGLADRHAPGLHAMVAEGERIQAELPGLRGDLDSGKASALTGLDFYNQALDVIGIGAKRLAASADDASVAFEHVVTSDMFFVIESVARAHSLAVYTRGTGDPEARTRLAAAVAQYRQPPMTVIANLAEGERDQAVRLFKSPDWSTLIAGDQAVLAAAPFDVAGWQRAAGVVLKGLTAIYLTHTVHTTDLAEENGRTALWMSLIGGVGIALVAVLAAAFTFRAATSLIRRLKDLRRRTLDLADHELPELIAKIGAGERIDPHAGISRLDFGSDELGEVAKAFEKAQHVALAAAVAESETRQGVRAVFLSIAHRSQAIVHRQLEELDRIERSEDNPDLLDRLFRLDHLATRTRRNAENLIILGGEQVGRQWRKPVSLRDVVRGAISETKHYTRVTTPVLPDVLLDGSVVADVGHLIAELVDNGTAFSPPDSRVEVRGTVVGKGVVVEVEDQGLGITDEQLRQLNETLANPPDFSFMALAGDLPIGLFVVARLAAKHGVRVTLRESAYGGVQAIVLLPTSLLARPDSAGPPADLGVPEQPGPTTVVRQPEPLPAPPASPPPPPAAPARPAPPAARTAEVASRPPLPTRVRQSSLAPQLTEAPDHAAARDDLWPEADVRRSSSALGAFQRGSALARSEAAAASAGPEMKAGR
ncbi:Histidine kinase-, DNA gyrase B-, and HSP90-like ATPase [Actinokineospora alba]|uniref:histidine kinase n=1 Tax=Actinokineospora alba TaxID=504798 RepID=A0A1H0LT76_9PSEU|nr:nitrate- and nitrite sensing domain-containing protein [Actinokineospora alba]TDP67450.1 histidine kinase/DNA gyrase B/HSP90-like ATPase [Actinokineospora alba]SDI96270.1 Histidine kinase-, DNA gyrase B-, and HSP90-like ATPase [Actinokineospora alba]SDO71459.1 Histidine kinase-, DNA gyrase B-, and HSP90-like ATPase [Actinokineospora alba]